MKRIFSVILFLFFLPCLLLFTSCNEEEIDITWTWEKVLGTDGEDIAWTILQTGTEGYRVIGRSAAPDVSFIRVLVHTLDNRGLRQNVRTFTPGSFDFTSPGTSLPLPDGRMVVSGAADGRIFLLEVDPEGNPISENFFFASSEITVPDLAISPDGSYYLAFYQSTLATPLPRDLRVVKISPAFNVEWERTIEVENTWSTPEIALTADDILMVGATTSGDQETKSDLWLCRLNSLTGETLMEETFAELNNQFLNDLIPTDDGHFLMVAQEQSEEFVISSSIRKVNTEGGIIWEQSNWGILNAATNTTDGGFALAGYVDRSSTGSFLDANLIKLDGAGNLQWERVFSDGEYEENFNSVIQTKDGGYAVAGSTRSSGNGLKDFWILKLDENGEL